MEPSSYLPPRGLVLIGIVTRTSNPDQYYVAGRGVPAFYNGMATGSDWMSAASFISMGGARSAQASPVSPRHGVDGGYLLLAVFLGPYLRQFGAYTIPDLLGARYGGNAARIVGVVGTIACSFEKATRAAWKPVPVRGLPTMHELARYLLVIVWFLSYMAAVHLALHIVAARHSRAPGRSARRGRDRTPLRPW